MAGNRTSFVLHLDSLAALEFMTMEQRGVFITALISKRKGEHVEADPLMMALLTPFFAAMDRDDEKYEKVSEARRSAGSKGGRARVANQAIATPDQANQAIATFACENPSKPSEKEKEKEKEKETGSDQKKKPVSQPLDFSCWPSMPSDQLLADWKALRKRHKADITQTVITGVGKQLREAAKNGFTVEQCFEEWICRGWRGFKAEWMSGSARPVVDRMQNKLPYGQHVARTLDAVSNMEWDYDV